MKTIREKVMKAWVDERVIEVRPKVGTYQSPGVGEVLFVSEGKAMFAIWSASRRSRLDYMVDDIADICFVDEDGVNLADDGSIMGDFQKERTAAAEEKHGIVKELWGWGMGGKGLYVINDDGSMTLLATASHLATPEQTATMAAAPELLNVLEEYDRGMGKIGITLQKEFAERVQSVIAKARGLEDLEHGKSKATEATEAT